jgi:hypothetical protein
MRNFPGNLLKTIHLQRSLMVILLLAIFCFSFGARAQADGGKKEVLIGGHTPRQILAKFKFKGVLAVTDNQWASYRRVFGFLDADRDGRHSKQEYIVNGVHMNEQSRRGIFAASDSDKDGYVSEAEYVHNRIITDEAKEIFYRMDTNRDNRLTEKEMIAGGHFKNEKLAKAVFKALDINDDGRLIIPEYLRVWGGWART